ncbi:helix-turn-helix domain-containing protein [Clostridioides difficile]
MFKNNLKYYRKCKGMTQIQLARKAGITNDYISQIERGIKILDFLWLRRFLVF